MSGNKSEFNTGGGAPYRKPGEVMKDPKRWVRRSWTDMDELNMKSITWICMTGMLAIFAVLCSIDLMMSFIQWNWTLPETGRASLLVFLFAVVWFFATYKRV